MSLSEVQAVYVGKVGEAVARITACERFLEAHQRSQDIFQLEAAVLQIRKALESIAFAAIAPNKVEYESFRASAEEPADFRRDFNARAILKYLSKINLDFYPTPLLPPARRPDNTVHFERRTEGVLTKSQFEAFYDRLGKFLHSDNPWGTDKGTKNLADDLPRVIRSLRHLLEWHFTVIRSPQFNGVWVVEVPTDGRQPHVFVAETNGEFIVQPLGTR
jgi:hypothetical protein